MNKLSLLNLFESLLDEFGVPMDSQSFNMEQFKALRSFNKRVQYCNQHLKRISSGSSRIVYQLNENLVLKLAKNEKGIQQNNTESDHYIQQTFPDVIAKVHQWDNDDLWIVSDLAKKATKNRFKQIVGMDIEKVDWYFNLRYAEHNGKKVDHIRSRFTPEEIEFLDNSEFCGELINMMFDFDMPPGDFGRLSSYGEVMRNGKPAIVSIDYGLTQNTYDSYYK